MMAAYNPPIRCGIWGNPPTNKIDKHGGGYHFLFQLSPCVCVLFHRPPPPATSAATTKLANPLPCPYKGKLHSTAQFFSGWRVNDGEQYVRKATKYEYIPAAVRAQCLNANVEVATVKLSRGSASQG